MGFISGILGNVIANIVFWLGLGMAVWFATSASRRRFLRFFGLDGDTSITVYLSNLWVAGSNPPPFTPGPGHVGATISMHEFRAAQSISRLFGGAPGRLPELVSGLIDGVWIRRVVEPRVEVSPLRRASASVTTNSVVVGGSVRNSIRAGIVEAALPFLVFDHEQAGATPGRGIGGGNVIICRGARTGEVISGNLNLAIVEKLYDADRRAMIFCCNGIRGDTSWAAAEYLRRHWRSLEREYGDRGFAICLGFPERASYMEIYAEPQRLLSIPD